MTSICQVKLTWMRFVCWLRKKPHKKGQTDGNPGVTAVAVGKNGLQLYLPRKLHGDLVRVKAPKVGNG